MIARETLKVQMPASQTGRKISWWYTTPSTTDIGASSSGRTPIEGAGLLPQRNTRWRPRHDLACSQRHATSTAATRWSYYTNLTAALNTNDLKVHITHRVSSYLTSSQLSAYDLSHGELGRFTAHSLPLGSDEIGSLEMRSAEMKWVM